MAEFWRKNSEKERLVQSHSKTAHRRSTNRRVVEHRCKCFKQSTCAPKKICISSKPIMLILAWAFVVGGIYEGAGIASTVFVKIIPSNIVGSAFYPIIAVYVLLAVVNMFYPLSGLLADVYCGRYRIVVISLCILWFCLALITIPAILNNIFHRDISTSVLISMIVISGLAYLLFIPAQAGFTANIVQLGFDQLLDEPSLYLGMFVHWYIWASVLGEGLVHIPNAFKECTQGDGHFGIITLRIVYYGPTAFCVLLSVLLIINFCAHHLFYAEPARYNPYLMIVKVLNFARKNKRPLQRPSAFVTCDYKTKPSRLDFAKDIFGGPFASSDVNDVKAFVRVLFVLLGLAPVFVLNVPTSYLVFPIFSLHSGRDTFFQNATCSARWVLLESGTLSYITVLLIIPVYIWVVYSVLRNRVPKILHRLGFAIVLFIVAVVSMLIVDFTGHVLLHTEGVHNATCMFVEPILYHSDTFVPLYLNWAVLILPNILMGLSSKLILATTLEFISAQSPHSMKGVLVGMLFAVMGFYQLIGASVVFPFSVLSWKHGHIKHNSTVASCGFGYFLVTIFIAVIGLVCFVVCARKYKYRVRDEEGFSQSDVEEVFERRLLLQEEQRHIPLFVDSEASEYDSMLLPYGDNGSDNLNRNRSVNLSGDCFIQTPTGRIQ